MSRFTRWRDRQKAKRFLGSFQPIGDVSDWGGEIRKTGIVEFQRIQVLIAPKASERIMKQALGGLVKPDKNK